MKICFWGNIAGALKGNTDGGGELQLALLAKALAKGGNEVVVIDFETDEDFITADGIKVFRIKGWNNGIRIIRTITHRLPQLYKSLKAQNADVYYCRIRDFRHILSFWAARKVKAKFVLGLASDLDAMNLKMRWKYNHLVSKGGLWAFSSGFLIELVYPFLLRKADLILVQHEGQKTILAKKNINSVVFPNLFELSEPQLLPSNFKKDFIYVGWLDKRKGFVEMFEVIKKSPQHTFTIVGPPSDNTGLIIFEKLKTFPNVKLLGKLSHTNTLHQILNSKALISTSAMEGFPNIFIEAWSFGIPVLSLYVDPGDIIKNEKLGTIAHGNMDRLLSAMENVDNSIQFKNRARAYVENNHVLNPKEIHEVNSMFNKLLVIGTKEEKSVLRKKNVLKQITRN
jgi:glycosyltransferase involved in cell wall biosynthesis